MPVIAPWLRSPDVLGALQAGSSAGLSRNRLGLQSSEDAEAAQEAGAKLRQSQDAMGIQQQQFQQEMAQRAQSSQAAQQLRQAQNEFTNILRTQQQKEREARLQQQAQGLKDAEQKASSAAASLRAAHQDQVGFMSEAPKVGVSEALLKYPETPANVVQHYATLEQQKALAEKKTDKSQQVQVEEKLPAVEAVPAQDASKGFLGLGADLLGAHPAVPAIPGRPETIRRYTQPLNSPTSTAAAPSAGESLNASTPNAAQDNVSRPFRPNDDVPASALPPIKIKSITPHAVQNTSAGDVLSSATPTRPVIPNAAPPKQDEWTPEDRAKFLQLMQDDQDESDKKSAPIPDTVTKSKPDTLPAKPSVSDLTEQFWHMLPRGAGFTKRPNLIWDLRSDIPYSKAMQYIGKLEKTDPTRARALKTILDSFPEGQFAEGE